MFFLYIRTFLKAGWENNNTFSVLFQANPFPVVAMVMGTVSPGGGLWSSKITLVYIKHLRSCSYHPSKHKSKILYVHE